MHWNVARGIYWGTWLDQDAVSPQTIWRQSSFGRKLDSHRQIWIRISIFTHGNDFPKCNITGRAKGPILHSRPHTLSTAWQGPPFVQYRARIGTRMTVM